jgi:hypothetical protein
VLDGGLAVRRQPVADVSGVGQGDLQESFHPNAYAQRGLGRCLTLLWAASPGRYACRNTPGQSYTAMTLAPA